MYVTEENGKRDIRVSIREKERKSNEMFAFQPSPNNISLFLQLLIDTTENPRTVSVVLKKIKSSFISFSMT